MRMSYLKRMDLAQKRFENILEKNRSGKKCVCTKCGYPLSVYVKGKGFVDCKYVDWGQKLCIKCMKENFVTEIYVDDVWLERIVVKDCYLNCVLISTEKKEYYGSYSAYGSIIGYEFRNGKKRLVYSKRELDVSLHMNDKEIEFWNKSWAKVKSNAILEKLHQVIWGI